jgi:hypothetical protein
MAEAHLDRGDSGNAGRSKSIVLLGAGDPLARRVTRALITSGHTVTVAVFDDDVRESFGASRRVFRAADPDALRRAVASHDAVINLEPVIGEPRSTLGALLGHRARRCHDATAAVLAALDAPAGPTTSRIRFRTPTGNSTISWRRSPGGGPSILCIPPTQRPTATCRSGPTDSTSPRSGPRPGGTRGSDRQHSPLSHPTDPPPDWR